MAECTRLIYGEAVLRLIKQIAAGEKMLFKRRTDITLTRRGEATEMSAGGAKPDLNGGVKRSQPIKNDSGADTYVGKI